MVGRTRKNRSLLAVDPVGFQVAWRSMSKAVGSQALT